MNRTDLSEKQWRQLEPHLPHNPHRGHAYVEHRRVLNGILWRLKTGAPWRDVPAQYGPWQTCYDRFVRWARDGTWQRVLQLLQAKADASGQIDWDGAALDSTHIKAHRSATGARKSAANADKREVLSNEWLGRSRGGRNSKIHLCVDGNARPLSLIVTAGQRADVTQLAPVLNAIAVPRLGPGRPRKRPTRLRVDRAYGARKARELVQSRGIRCICPEREDAKANRLRRGSRGGSPPSFNPDDYKGRNVVERAINRLKDFRAVATRYDKRGHNFLASVIVATIAIWLL